MPILDKERVFMINNYEDNNGYSRPEVLEQNDNSSGCTTCRQKVAQQTFDMVVGGTSYGPLLDIITLYQVPTIAVGGGLTVPQSPADYEVNVIDMLYGSRIPSYKQMSTIDALYGKGDEIQNTPRNPCWYNNNNEAYKYPDKFYLYNYIFGKTISNECSIKINFISFYEFLFLPKNITIDISLEDCCNSFKMNLFCAIDDDLISQAYDKFKDCVQLKIESSVNQFMFNNPDILKTISMPNDLVHEDPWKSIIRQTDNILMDIESSKGIFLHLPHYEKSDVTGYNSNNSNSCLCGGLEPTYCCHPELNPYCLDENGKPKNLCSFRKKVEKIIIENKKIIDLIWELPKDIIGFVSREGTSNIFSPYMEISIEAWIKHLNDNGFRIGFPYGVLDITKGTQGIFLTHHDNSYFKLKEIWLLFLYYLDWLQKYPNETPPNDFFIMLRRENSIDVVNVKDYTTFINALISILGLSKDEMIKYNKQSLMELFVEKITDLLKDSSENNIIELFSKLGFDFYKFSI